MLLQRTEKARLELWPSAGAGSAVRTLGLRERSVLLLATGDRSIFDFRPMFGGRGEQIALDLIEQGYLEINRTTPAPAPVEPASVQAAASDAFQGKRSLATTRMFLFDLGERMFARRDRALAGHFREALRAARDRESMLAVSREMIEEIERIAGPERADSISERLAMLLPAETAG